MSEWKTIDSAPKDGTRILGFGAMGFEREHTVATVCWNTVYGGWNVDPNEATEYDPESCNVTHWM
jgi:hypothetical protein